MSGFRHLADRLIHRGFIWSVYQGTFEAPDGTTFQRDIVRSPGAVGAVPVFDDGGAPTTVLVRQYRPPFDAEVLEIPAGMRDIVDEPVEVTAGRELVEEVGLRAATLTPLMHFYPSAGMTDSVLHLFVASDLTEVDTERHGVEEAHMEVVRIRVSDAVRMIETGVIHDAKTTIGLLMVDRLLANGWQPAPLRHSG
jgi:8-oxo-dGTP pyrophosphatase MutT (NUDIX family)